MTEAPNYDEDEVVEPTLEPEEAGIESEIQVDPVVAGIYEVNIRGIVAAENFLEAQMHVFRSLVACNELPVRFYSSTVELVQPDERD